MCIRDSSYSEVVRTLTGGLLQKLKTVSRPKKANEDNLSLQGQSAVETSGEEDAETLLKLQIHSQLIKEMDLKKDLTNTKGDKNKADELRNKTQQVISNITDRLAKGVTRDQRSRIIKEVLDESLGCLLYTSPSPRDLSTSRMPSSA